MKPKERIEELEKQRKEMLEKNDIKGALYWSARKYQLQKDMKMIEEMIEEIQKTKWCLYDERDYTFLNDICEKLKSQVKSE